MADDIQTKLQNYRTAPFDARFPNSNQTRNCWSNYLDYHRCQKALDAKGVDNAPCDWSRNGMTKEKREPFREKSKTAICKAVGLQRCNLNS
ncbi:hypothetical protein ABVT39_009255 [Epinephelus coioides]